MDPLHIVEALTSLPAVIFYVVILCWLIAESAAVPIPCEAILLCAGFLVGVGHLVLPVALVASVVGSLAGASLAWWIARRFGRLGVERVGRYVLLTPERLEVAENFFRRRGAPTIFIGRLLPVVRTVISYPAGLADMSYGPFVVATVIGAAIYNLAILLLGRAVGANWTTLFNRAHSGLDVVGVVVIVLVVGYLVLHHLIQRRYQRAVD
ncbi:MAG TPA: DedA family protein [Candidatus Dormibacteraeota bacterium]|jgi:membrane protein DedA with SNARE-associated domain|nr:DedA family protein [Candidatus Dormibacteraeota bacterium]